MKEKWERYGERQKYNLAAKKETNKKNPTKLFSYYLSDKIQLRHLSFLYFSPHYIYLASAF